MMSLRHVTLVLCRFEGCDEDARATVGTTPLCALHESLILDSLDAATVVSLHGDYAKS